MRKCAIYLLRSRASIRIAATNCACGAVSTNSVILARVTGADGGLTMAEYIEREAAKLRIFEYGVRHRDNSSISFACENLERQMNSIPAADVRPVKWIPVTERLPEPEGHSEYIVCVKHFNPEYTRNVLVTTAEFEARLIECGDGPYWVGHNDGITRVTHWMPLPPAPKEE